MRLAVLDDYQGYSRAWPGWSSARELSVVTFDDHLDDLDRLAERLHDFDAVLRIRERTAFPRALLERLPKLRLLLATGVRNAGSIDLPAAEELGIVVCATGAHHASTVDVAWGLILALFRRLPEEIASVRGGGWQTGLGRTVAGRVLGVVGLGNMGAPVARIGIAFGMRVIAWSPHLTPERTAPLGVDCVSKSALFENSDVITIHMPASPATRGLADAACIARMRADAFLVNTARASLVDNEALIAALRAGRIAGAGLDVFDIEPLPADHPYRTLPNVLATPHIGFVTVENYQRFFAESLENLTAFRQGAPIRVISSRQPAAAGFDG